MFRMDDAVPHGSPLEIRAEDLHKSFNQKHVLNGISLDIRRGEMIAVVGESGGGKTVLLKHFMGRLQPDAGRVFVADHESPGTPLRDLSTLDDGQMDRLRRHWAVVFQKNALYTGTVYDNIALGLEEIKGYDVAEIARRVREAVAAVGLDPDHVPQLAREELSGGMAKRVALARAMALDPALIFYDEPTTGLDPEHAGQIQQLIRTVHQRKPDPQTDRTTVIVTHDAALLFHLQPRVVMLHGGKVFFDGSTEQFSRSDSPVIRPYLELMPILHGRRGSP
jgi:phospholipid/cholesterol/gamma-HCH transport system ATP-binding protein